MFALSTAEREKEQETMEILRGIPVSDFATYFLMKLKQQL